MSLLYVNEHGAVIGIDGNRFSVQFKDGMRRFVPSETLEGIVVLGAFKKNHMRETEKLTR